MALRLLSLLSALHCILAAIVTPARFAATSWTNITPGVRVYFATSDRTGIQELATNGDPNANPNTYKSWQQAIVLTTVSTATSSDFAAVNSNGQKIFVFFERDGDNGETSLASVQWTSITGWTIGDFSVPSGSFRPGTRIAAAVLASGQTSVFYQDVSNLVYEKAYDGSHWSEPLLVGFGGEDTELATCVYTEKSTGIEKMFVYMRDTRSSQIYEYLWQTKSSTWNVNPVPNFSTTGSLAVVNLWGTTSYTFFPTSDGKIWEVDGYSGTWFNIRDLANPSNVALGSDITATVQIVNDREWMYVFFTGPNGTLWQESYTWTGTDNSDWADPFMLTI